MRISRIHISVSVRGDIQFLALLLSASPHSDKVITCRVRERQRNAVDRTSISTNSLDLQLSNSLRSTTVLVNLTNVLLLHPNKVSMQCLSSVFTA